MSCRAASAPVGEGCDSMVGGSATAVRRVCVCSGSRGAQPPLSATTSTKIKCQRIIRRTTRGPPRLFPLRRPSEQERVVLRHNGRRDADDLGVDLAEGFFLFVGI